MVETRSEAARRLERLLHSEKFREQTEREREEERRREEREKEARRVILRERSGIPAIFSDAFFKNWKADTKERMQVLNKARNYFNFVFYRRKIGLVLQGPTGTGKSRMAATIANELIQQDIPVRFILSAEAPDTDARDLKNTPFLVIDDIGMADTDARTRTLVTKIIARRYYNGLATIITTNNTGEELATVFHRAVLHRIGEQAIKIDFAGIANNRTVEARRLENEFSEFERNNNLECAE